MLVGFPIAVFDEAAAEAAASIRFELERVGQVIGPHDLMIAGIAVANGHSLVTHNTREFSRVQGLQWVSWQETC